MFAAVSSPVSSPVSSNAARVPLAPQSRRRQRQRFLEWDRDVAAEGHRPASTRSATPGERASRERAPVGGLSAEGTSFEGTPIERPPVTGPRRMADVMPDVLARYGLTL